MNISTYTEQIALYEVCVLELFTRMKKQALRQ